MPFTARYDLSSSERALRDRPLPPGPKEAQFGVRELAPAFVEGACSRRISSRLWLAGPAPRATAASCLTESGSELPHSKIGPTNAKRGVILWITPRFALTVPRELPASVLSVPETQVRAPAGSKCRCAGRSAGSRRTAPPRPPGSGGSGGSRHASAG